MAGLIREPCLPRRSSCIGIRIIAVKALELELLSPPIGLVWLLANGVPLGARSLLEFMPLSGEAMPELVPFGVGTDCTRPMAPGLMPLGDGVDCTTPGAVIVDFGAVDGAFPAGGAFVAARAVGAWEP